MKANLSTTPKLQPRAACATAARWLEKCLLGMLLLLAAHADGATVSEDWVRRYSYGGIGSYDNANKVVADADGNIIVAGYTSEGINGTIMLIIKYSGAGVPLWTNRCSALGNNRLSTDGIAVDSSGNVFFAGSSKGSGTTMAYIMIKYSDAGVPMWTNRYIGPGKYDNYVAAVAVDGSGNAFVTGYSYGGNGMSDYATIKYSSTGVPLWTNRYDGPVNGYDYSTAMAVDSSGNVFVTGTSPGTGGYPDYLTIAYSGAGVPLWINRYSGPGNATAITVGDSGNVFVTGASSSIDGYPDFLTIAYSGVGTPLWTNRYSGPGSSDDQPTAIAVDGSGNVFITGRSSGTGTNSYPIYYLTVAYSAAGVPLWTNRYNGSGDIDVQPSAIAVDGGGNAFVTGMAFGTNGSFDYVTIAYSGAGMPLWTNRYNEPGNSTDRAYAIAVDGNGNVFVTGYSTGSDKTDDFATIAYSGTGVPLWTNRYGGAANYYDSAAAVAVDGTGKVFVTGSSRSTASLGSEDFATIAYSGTGMPLWTNRYNGSGNGTDYPNAIALDGTGNVFVTGASVGNGSAFDYATIAYSGTGAPLWTNRYKGTGNGDHIAAALAVGKSGNVFVTGRSLNYLYADGYATIAYSGTGVPLWTNRYEGTNSAQAKGVVVDGNGNVFVSGVSDDDFTTIAYSGAGVPLWTNRYNGPGNSIDNATALAVDSSGNIFVAGYSYGSGGTLDYATVKYSVGGMSLWTNRYNGPGNDEDRATGVVVDGTGNVFVTGHSDTIAHATDFTTIKYSAAGVSLWTNRYNETGNTVNYPHGIAVDRGGNVFITGESDSSDGVINWATVAYSGAGMPLWTNRCNDGDKPASLTVGIDGAVYVTGTAGGDYATVKYVLRPELAIQPETASSSNVGLVLSGAPGYSWAIERAIAISGPWTNLGSLFIGTNGSAQFQDTNSPSAAAFYRARQP